MSTITEATGDLSTHLRSGQATLKEQPALDVGAGFDGNESAGHQHADVQTGGPYNTKWSALAFIYGVKMAFHAHDRMEERTPFHRSHVDVLQRAVDSMGLDPGSYHLPLRGKDGGVLGYAQFKGVPNRKTPVLATVLGPKMKPGGSNIEEMLKLSATPPLEFLRTEAIPAVRPTKNPFNALGGDTSTMNTSMQPGQAPEPA